MVVVMVVMMTILMTKAVITIEVLTITVKRNCTVTHDDAGLSQNYGVKKLHQWCSYIGHFAQ